MPSGRTHFVAGTIAAGAALYYTNGPMEYSLIGGLAALLPDIDHKKSIAGRLIPFWLLPIKHRGFTHSYAALFLVLWLTMLLENQYLVITVTSGYLSHIWLDWSTKMGVQLWWPKKQRSSLRKMIKRGVR